MTTLIIKSNNEPESDINETILDMLKNISNREVIESDYNELGYSFPLYKIEYEEHELIDLKETINAIYDIMLFPHDEYESISSKDFTIEIESVRIDPSFNHLYEKQNEFNDARFATLAMVSDELATDNKKLEEKIDAVYAFLQASGLLHYKQTMAHVMNTLQEHKILNADDVSSKIFPKIH